MRLGNGTKFYLISELVYLVILPTGNVDWFLVG